jgi:hypothetical protein
MSIRVVINVNKGPAQVQRRVRPADVRRRRTQQRPRPRAVVSAPAIRAGGARAICARMRVYCAGNGPSPALRAFTPPRGFCVAERAAADGRGMRRAMGGSARRGFDGFFISDCTALELMQNVKWDDCKHPWPSEGGSCRCVHVWVCVCV